MQTFVVEVLNEKAVPLLRDLENLDIIRLIPQEAKPVEEPKQNRISGRLSEQFRGSIPPEVAADLHRQLEEMRNEWERDI
ncbi:hypothetical protein [Larkinella knui]|uniref:Uncharacterized protein n=1 Tax=Larkinella knui TaxID=2025310 RepID=A0A3P1CJU4_9BACT|nr:hypothetical protein [Larkinella knui]RRB13613.1 hypothetical protein EHT87_15245 [Larkinella knui]